MAKSASGAPVKPVKAEGRQNVLPFPVKGLSPVETASLNEGYGSLMCAVEDLRRRVEDGTTTGLCLVETNGGKHGRLQVAGTFGFRLPLLANLLASALQSCILRMNDEGVAARPLRPR